MTFQERYLYNPATDLLGKGGFARVFKAKDILLDRDVAIKIFNATDKGQYTVIEEIKKAIRLHHPNLLRYYDVAVIENTNALGEAESIQIGVMELANAGDLKQFARKNPGSPALFGLLKQVLSGLEYLHQKGIIHRDMKPQNILLVEEDGELTAKISDFGISKNLDSGTNSSSMAIGTIEYMAPEQFSPGKYGINGKIGTNVDLWSFGIMVHELLTNEPLFGQRSGNTTAEQIMNAILSQTLPPGIETLPEPYRTVVRRCLVTDAKQRIQKAHELMHLLETTEPVSNSETLVLDKKIFNRQNPSSETQVLPKINEQNENDYNSIPEIELPETSKKKSYKYLWIILVVVVGGVSAFLFLNSSGSSEAEKEYKEAMLHYGDPTSYFLSHLEKSSDLGYDSAKIQLAKYYSKIGRDKEAISLLQSLIEFNNGDPSTKYPGILALYASALGNTGDKPAALKAWMACAFEGDPECEFQLGMLYYKGNDVTKDFSKALDYFKKAADSNDSRAETMLGNMYLMGQGVEVNNSEAIKNYFKAADQGNTVAMYSLGLAYANGSGVEKNENEAKKWFQKVVDRNDNADAVTAAKQQLGLE